jgi:hypothetical protein
LETFSYDRWAAIKSAFNRHRSRAKGEAGIGATTIVIWPLAWAVQAN